MAQVQDRKQRLKAIRRNLIIDLVIDSFIPFCLYLVLEHIGLSSLNALAISGAIPVVHTIALGISQRKLNWIGIISAIGFLVEYVSALWLGGNTLFLKINDLLLTGPLGAVLLISALAGKPLLLLVGRLVASDQSAPTGRPSDPASRKHVTRVTAGLGLLLIAHAALGIVLAVILPTTTFLVVSKILTWSLLAIAILVIRFLRVAADRKAT
jgi:hypothetical protein